MAIRVVGAAIFRGDRVLAARRGPDRALAGMWEFPGGKVEPGESDRDALIREIAEELGLAVEVGEPLGVSEHGPIALAVYACTASGEPAPTEHEAIRWLAADALDSVVWAPADVPLLAAVEKRLRC
jgi:8-oxo-dGTP diphosphatase